MTPHKFLLYNSDLDLVPATAANGFDAGAVVYKHFSALLMGPVLCARELASQGKAAPSVRDGVVWWPILMGKIAIIYLVARAKMVRMSKCNRHHGKSRLSFLLSKKMGLGHNCVTASTMAYLKNIEREMFHNICSTVT
ncbi:MAG: hypothetical protein ABIP64_01805 [Burkholderiales bacterium]